MYQRDLPAWREANFVEEEAQAWIIELQMSGTAHSAAKAEAWRDAGFTPSKARAWLRATGNGSVHLSYLKPNEAAEWRDAGFTPSQAKGWIRNGVTPKRAAEWRDRDFSVSDYKAWSSHASAAAAAEWRDHGFSAQLKWGSRRGEGEAFESWARLGLLPSEAARLRDVGWNPRRAGGARHESKTRQEARQALARLEVEADV